MQKISETDFGKLTVGLGLMSYTYRFITLTFLSEG